MLHAATRLGLLFLIAAVARSQSVSDRNGRIFFTDRQGVRKPITDGKLDSQPNLSSDKRQVVFVRQTPGRTAETGVGDTDKTELWIAYVDGSKPPRRVLTGGNFIEGPNLNIMVAGFGNPQFSRDATRIYFTAAAWPTQAEILMLDVTTGDTRPLFEGLRVEVRGNSTMRSFNWRNA